MRTEKEGKERKYNRAFCGQIKAKNEGRKGREGSNEAVSTLDKCQK